MAAPSASGSTTPFAKTTRFSRVSLVEKAAAAPSGDNATDTAVSVPATGRTAISSTERVLIYQYQAHAHEGGIPPSADKLGRLKKIDVSGRVISTWIGRARRASGARIREHSNRSERDGGLPTAARAARACEELGTGCDIASAAGEPGHRKHVVERDARLADVAQPLLRILGRGTRRAGAASRRRRRRQRVQSARARRTAARTSEIVVAVEARRPVSIS